MGLDMSGKCRVYKTNPIYFGSPLVSNETIFWNQYIQRLKDQYIQTWRLNCEESRKLNYYKIFKMNFSLESYITKIEISLGHV